MDIIRIIIALGVAILVSFIAMHSWVFICDFIIGGIKKIFRIEKKENINWHSLDNTCESISKDKVKQSKVDMTENKRIL